MCGWAVTVNHLGVKTPLAEVVELGWYGDSPISWYLLLNSGTTQNLLLGVDYFRCTTLTFVAVFCIYERKPPQPQSLQLR